VVSQVCVTVTAGRGPERAPLSDVLAGIRRDDHGLVWIHASDPKAAADELESFGLHEVAVESLREGVSRPRVEEYPDHVYASVVYADPVVQLVPGEELPRLSELALFIGPNWVISVGGIPEPAIAELAVRLQHRVFARGLGPHYLLVYLLEWAIDSLYSVLDDTEERADQLEDLIVFGPPPAPMQQLFTLKKDIIVLRRRVAPLRDAIQRLSLLQGDATDTGAEVYFRNLHDDVLHMLELIDTHRDILSSALDLYLTTVSNRLNEVMKTLTAVATIFMPLTFITGFFGMNFVQLPFGSDIWFFVMLAAVFGSVTALLVFFQRKRWW
jgi:magnesium transporter